jgi:hypothetical protein
MGSNFWSRCSLGAEVENYLGTQPVPLDDISITMIKRWKMPANGKEDLATPID